MEPAILVRVRVGAIMRDHDGYGLPRSVWVDPVGWRPTNAAPEMAEWSAPCYWYPGDIVAAGIVYTPDDGGRIPPQDVEICVDMASLTIVSCVNEDVYGGVEGAIRE